MPKVDKVYIWRDERRLPATYQEVEYIQSTATNPGSTSSSGQYINTGYTHNPNTKVEIDFQYTVTTVQQRMFGSETTNSSYSTFVTYINGSTQRARATKDGEGNWQSTSVSADTNRHTFILDKSTYKIYTNGTQVHSGSNAYTITKNGQYPLLLMATYNTNYANPVEHASAKLYGCKIWDNDILVREFVPCYRKSDSVIGLYDLVNDVFYTNAGSGTFAKGNDIPDMVEHQVRPTEITETYTRSPFQSSVSIYKSGYKIKQAIMEWEGKYTGSSWYITEPKINSSGVVFSCIMSVGGSYGYNYGDGQGRYGGIRILASSYTGIVSVNSGATTSSQNAGRVIITPESIEYHIGKTFDSWLQEGTITPSSTISGNITTLFNSNDVNINGSCWNSSTSTFNFYRCIVTYEPI